MEQGVVGRDAGYAQHRNIVLTQQQTVFRRGQPTLQSVAQPVPDREMLARVKEFDGDDDKLLAEYQQIIE